MKHLFIVLMFVACTPDPSPVSTGCWTGMKGGKRQLIGCYTEAQVVQAEQSQSWSSILVKYTDLKYEAKQTCETCNKKYP